MTLRSIPALLFAFVAVTSAAVAWSAEDAEKKEPAKKQPNIGVVRQVAPIAVRQAAGGNYLLRSPAVQEELKLNDEQKALIKKGQEELQALSRELYQGIAQLDPDARRKKQTENIKKRTEKQAEIDKKIAAALSDKQQTRLEQITLQLRGIVALRDPKVADRLDLSKEQQQQIDKIQKETVESRQNLFRNNAGGDRAKRVEQARELAQQSEKKTMEVLTDKQREAFQKMKGEKFEMPGARFQAIPARIQLRNAQPRKIQIRPKKAEGDA